MSISLNEDFKKNLLNLYKDYSLVSKVYKQKSGRLFLVLYGNSKHRTISYPKALMEVVLNRRLLENETIDHIDKNFLNNELSNLRVLDRSIHVSIDNKRRVPKKFECDYCGKEFYLTKDQINNKKGHGKFCSKHCSGKYGKEIQLGLRNKIIKRSIKIEYFSIKDIE